MCDCVWCFICCGCNGTCDKYISVNEEQGKEILTNYTKEVDEALEPLKLKYQKMMEDL